MQTQNIPAGLCQCGCGERTTVPTKNNPRLGRVRGRPMRYIRGHSGRPANWQNPYRVDPETGCWIWERATGRGGYGRVWSEVDHTMRYAHVVMYEQARGPVPKGHQLHHTCRNPRCVNPDHVEPLSPAEHKRSHSKLSAADVADIRTSKEMGVSLARKYDISQAAVSFIRSGQRWAESPISPAALA